MRQVWNNPAEEILAVALRALMGNLPLLHGTHSQTLQHGGKPGKHSHREMLQ